MEDKDNQAYEIEKSVCVGAVLIIIFRKLKTTKARVLVLFTLLCRLVDCLIACVIGFMFAAVAVNVAVVRVGGVCGGVVAVVVFPN